MREATCPVSPRSECQRRNEKPVLLTVSYCAFPRISETTDGRESTNNIPLRLHRFLRLFRSLLFSEVCPYFSSKETEIQDVERSY